MLPDNLKSSDPLGIRNYSTGSATINPNPVYYTPEQQWSNFGNNVAASLPQNRWSGTPLRDLFGVKTAYASDVLGTKTTNYSGTQSSDPYAGSQSTPGSNFSFGDPSNPDLSNPVKQADYNAYKSSQQTFSQPSAEDQLRSGISSGWDSYLSSLNDQLNNGLPVQRTAQENIANSQYDQGKKPLVVKKNHYARSLLGGA